MPRVSYGNWKVTNPEERRAYWRENSRRLSKRIQDYKESKPCMDCGVNYPYYVMDLDHVIGTKVAGVSRMKTWSDRRLQEELAKCELVCSNCHRIRTFLRTGMAESVYAVDSKPTGFGHESSTLSSRTNL